MAVSAVVTIGDIAVPLVSACDLDPLAPDATVAVKQVFGVIQEIPETGITVLLVEQSTNRALKIASRSYVLVGGRIVLTGPTVELRDDERLTKAYLGGLAE